MNIYPMRFRTIASGSSGNAYYLGLAGQHFLIDAGVSGKRIQQALFQMNVRQLSGIFITHEHSDHISGAGVMARRFNADVYAAPLTWRYFLRSRCLGALTESQVKVIEPDKPLVIGGVEITAFDIPHDATQPVGYAFHAGEQKMVLATDLGHVTDSIKERLKNAGLLLLESNYDPDMLAKSSYPRFLKSRIMSTLGHLSNAEAGMLLSEVVTPGVTHVVLAHLSEENNTPTLAFDTVRRILDGNNVVVRNLQVAARHVPGEVVEYE